MPEKNLERIYKISRIAIFAIPVLIISAIFYLILFPIETYKYLLNQPDLSKFEIKKNETENEISFGIFPTLNHRYIELKASLDQSSRCLENPLRLTLEKTYQAFLYPEGESIKNKEELEKYLFRDNKSRYPNGSLLHLKPTDEVFLISDGKKILFPGPEIFRAFGYSFDNLVDVDKSALDQFPNADNQVFLWTQPHPSGTIFQTYPSHKIYLIAGEKKHEIEKAEILSEAWSKYFTIAVDDPRPENQLTCLISGQEMKKGNISCLFDRQKILSLLGGYYNFTATFPPQCPAEEIQFNEVQIRLIPEKSFLTVKDSLRRIFASLVNRYFLKQPARQTL